MSMTAAPSGRAGGGVKEPHRCYKDIHVRFSGRAAEAECRKAITAPGPWTFVAAENE
jgi:hypothetical protein